MKRFVEGVDRGQSTLFPECLDDWVDEDNPVRVIDVFVEKLDFSALDFGGVDPKATGRPSYHPSILLKLYVYGYLNRIQSSRRLEREAGRNVEVMWLTGRLVQISEFPTGDFGSNRQAVSVETDRPFRSKAAPRCGWVLVPTLANRRCVIHPILLWSAKASTLVIIYSF
jgi:transposase